MWWPRIIQFFGPTDDKSTHHDFAAEVGLKQNTNDELRKAFLNMYLPKVEKYGLELPEYPRIEYTGREYTVNEDDLDWDEFFQIQERVRRRGGRSPVAGGPGGGPWVRDMMDDRRRRTAARSHGGGLRSMIWEVFRQQNTDDYHEHCREVHAPDREMAKPFAQSARPTQADERTVGRPAGENHAGRPRCREPRRDWGRSEKPWAVFRQVKPGGYHTHCGDVDAASSVDAEPAAIVAFTDDDPNSLSLPSRLPFSYSPILSANAFGSSRFVQTYNSQPGFITTTGLEYSLSKVTCCHVSASCETVPTSAVSDLSEEEQRAFESQLERLLTTSCIQEERSSF